MTEENETQKSEFDTFASAAMRGPRKTAYENNLSALVVKANQTSERLQKVLITCEAAFFTVKKEKIDMKLVENCNLVASSFVNIHKSKHQQTSMIFIPWAFDQTEANWKTLIEPWQKIDLRCYILYTDFGRQNYPMCYSSPTFSINEANERLEEDREARLKVMAELRKLPEYEQFYQKTGALFEGSLYALIAEFENWALRQLLPILSEITSQINPSIYSEVFKTMTRQIPEEKQEVEAED
jgi:hypothetical protein